MSSNKSVRRAMEKRYGKRCMIEQLGIRYIPKIERKKIKGYKKYQDEIQYHHLKFKSKGGNATIENGALLKGYNHTWFHSLDKETQSIITKMIIDYKEDIDKKNSKECRVNFVNNLKVPYSVNYMNIQADGKGKVKYNRAKKKQEDKIIIEDELEF